MKKVIKAADAETKRRNKQAKNTSDPNELRQFAMDPDPYVRARVADNMNTPQDVLHELADDSSRMVREHVARNPGISTKTLRKLFEMNDGNIDELIARHSPNLPETMLRELADRGWTLVRAKIADRDDTPLDVLEMLAQDESKVVRESVIDNPNSTPEIVRLAEQDYESAESRRHRERDDVWVEKCVDTFANKLYDSKKFGKFVENVEYSVDTSMNYKKLIVEVSWNTGADPVVIYDYLEIGMLPDDPEAAGYKLYRKFAAKVNSETQMYR